MRKGGSIDARLALLAGLYGSVGTGYSYGFSVYSGALKSSFDLTQSQLDNINTLPCALLSLMRPCLHSESPHPCALTSPSGSSHPHVS